MAVQEMYRMQGEVTKIENDVAHITLTRSDTGQRAFATLSLSDFNKTQLKTDEPFFYVITQDGELVSDHFEPYPTGELTPEARARIHAEVEEALKDWREESDY